MLSGIGNEEKERVYFGCFFFLFGSNVFPKKKEKLQKNYKKNNIPGTLGNLKRKPMKKENDVLRITVHYT